jgi:hypothetical protein
MPTNFLATAVDPNDNKPKPQATTGSWGWGPVTIEYTFSFDPEFFDADLKILGIKVVTVTLQANGVANVDFEMFGWSVKGTITIDNQAKDVVAELQISEGGAVKFDHKFVIFTWR